MKPTAISKEHFSVAASVSECLVVGILESSHKFSKISVEMKHYKNMSVMKHIIRNKIICFDQHILT